MNWLFPNYLSCDTGNYLQGPQYSRQGFYHRIMLTAQVYFVYFEKKLYNSRIISVRTRKWKKKQTSQSTFKRELKIQMNYLSLGWIIHIFHIKSENDFSSCNPHLNKKNSLSMALNVSKLSCQRESIAWLQGMNIC